MTNELNKTHIWRKNRV